MVALRPARDTELIVARAHVEAVRAAGLFEAAEWERRLAASHVAAGRGAVARAILPGGLRVVLKRMRRGGVLAPLWRDRYPLRRRLRRMLHMSSLVSARGIPTAPAVALLLRSGPPGLVRGWLATEEIEGASDLLSWIRSGQPVDEAMEAALALVERMHDAGLHHPDLNLANLLLRRRPDGTLETAIIDLDRVRARPGPLPARLRSAARRRLERSYRKHFGGPRDGRTA